jgi:Ca2+-binding RTX toxin-like protein
MEGGAGNDTYIVDNADDIVIEAADGGFDTAIVSLDFRMDRLANVEVLKLADGSSASRVTGGAGADHLIGNGAFNILDGGTGSDTMEGGAGDDVYLVDDAGDVVIEAAGGGADAVQTSVSYALSDSTAAEFLTALGSSALALVGNGLANTVSGNGGANVLHGMGGNDRVFAGAGKDKLYGDAGNDTLGGGAGRDQLTGGKGKASQDMFVFDTKLSTTRAAKAHVDTITDFGPRYDSVGFDDLVFTNKTIAKYAKTKGGASLDHTLKIDKHWFVTGDKAHDRNDFFIYNDKTHTLYYDADGSGHKAMVQVAVFSHFERHAGPLTYKDLFLV